MRAAAQLDGGSETNRSHLLTIFLTEERHCSLCFGFFNGNIAMLLDWVVAPDGSGHPLLHGTDLFRRHLLKVGEVEPQHLGRDIRSFLLHMVAEYLTQCLMHQVGGGMVAFGSGAFLFVDACNELPFNICGQLIGEVHRQVVLPPGIEDRDPFTSFSRCKATTVTHLSPHLGIEG